MSINGIGNVPDYYSMQAMQERSQINGDDQNNDAINSAAQQSDPSLLGINSPQNFDNPTGIQQMNILALTGAVRA